MQEEWPEFFGDYFNFLKNIHGVDRNFGKNSVFNTGSVEKMVMRIIEKLSETERANGELCIEIADTQTLLKDEREVSAKKSENIATLQNVIHQKDAAIAELNAEIATLKASVS